jgi:cellulose biosynthesis protein BcsQ
MTTAHFIMQGKGGVGKSLTASILMQYLLKQGLEVSGCDTDPVNSSLLRIRCTALSECRNQGVNFSNVTSPPCRPSI